MLRATAFAAAFVNAAVVTGDKNWVARAVKDRASFTGVGVVREPDVKVKVSYKTRQRIADEQRVVV